MKTKAEERERWGSREAWASGPAAKQRINALIDDVDETRRLLGNIVEAAELVRGTPQSEDLWNELMDDDGHVAEAAAFLKEPSES